jgi:Flp pilus assembly protein TadG
MWTRLTLTNSSKNHPSKGFLRRLRKDTRGTSAIEFAMVGAPFFLFIFGIMGYGLYFFSTTALEFGVETASRKIRTGQAQTDGITRAEFKQLICDAAGSVIDCSDAKVKVHIQSAANWAGISPIPCLSSGSLSSSAGSGTDAISGPAGGASQAVLVTVCYEWTLAQSMPFLVLSNMGNGSSMIQAAATFKTEPYQ